MYKIYPAILKTLEEEKVNPTANGIFVNMRTYKFLATTYMFHKVLPSVSLFSQHFQAKDLDISGIDSYVKPTTASIEEELNDDNSEQFIDDLSKYIARQDGDYQFHLSPTQDQIDDILQLRKSYYESLIIHIKNRFPHNHIISSLCRLFDPNLHTPSSSYGHTDIDILVNHYHAEHKDNDSTYEAVLGEWKFFKNWVKKLLTHPDLQMFPNLIKLARVALILPVNTAECERGFSTMRRVKTVLRSVMTNDCIRESYVYINES
jgi:hypothetical protein